MLPLLTDSAFVYLSHVLEIHEKTILCNYFLPTKLTYSETGIVQRESNLLHIVWVFLSKYYACRSKNPFQAIETSC